MPSTLSAKVLFFFFFPDFIKVSVLPKICSCGLIVVCHTPEHSCVVTAHVYTDCPTVDLSLSPSLN